MGSISSAPTSDAELRALFETLALQAGAVILDVFHASRIEAREKADHSPVTEADRRAESLILEGLRARCPFLSCVAEEETAAGLAPRRPDREFILIDPLDGTREFIKRGNDFTVNIALVRDSRPVIGVVYAPACGKFCSAAPGIAEALDVSGDGARIEVRRPITVSAKADRLRIVASRSHRTPATDEYLKRFPEAELVAIGSSLKFCLVAAGEADLYPRFGRTMEWDTAAGDAVLRAAGGTTRIIGGVPLHYGKLAGETGEAAFANPFFIASGSALPTEAT